MNHHHHHHRIQGLIGTGTKHVVRRTFAAAAAGKAKKGGGGGEGPRGSSLSKEINKSTTVVGANTLKDGSDPNISPDSSDYPDWLWRLLHNRPALSELRRKTLETLPYDDLKRFVKLHTRSKIKDNNSINANN